MTGLNAGIATFPCGILPTTQFPKTADSRLKRCASAAEAEAVRNLHPALQTQTEQGPTNPRRPTRMRYGEPYEAHNNRPTGAG